MAPTLKTYRMENHQVILWFDHAEGLQGQDGFFFPDAQGNLKPANVLIVGNNVILSHPDIPRPTVIYYQWADNPSCHGLHNRYGIPAEPFRLIP